MLVADANIWIDLDAGGLMGEAINALELETTDLVLHELTVRSLGERIRAMGVAEHSLTPQQVSEILERRRADARPSVADYSALVIASSLQVALLTGDRNLRTIATHSGVQVHGVLWVVERLVLGGLDGPRAADAIETMVARGSRLPADKVAERIRRYRG